MCSFPGVLDETVSHENVALRRAEKCIPVVTPYCVLSLHVLFASHIERGVANSSVPSVHLTVSLESGRKHDNFRYWPEISVSQHAFSVWYIHKSPNTGQLFEDLGHLHCNDKKSRTNFEREAHSIFPEQNLQMVSIYYAYTVRINVSKKSLHFFLKSPQFNFTKYFQEISIPMDSFGSLLSNETK